MKVKKIIILVIVIILGFVLCKQIFFIDPVEKEYKSTVGKFVRQFPEEALEVLDTNYSDDDLIIKNLKGYLPQYILKLEAIIEMHEQNLWLDDVALALYGAKNALSIVENNGQFDTEASMLRLAALIKKYPDFHLEDWSVSNDSFWQELRQRELPDIVSLHYQLLSLCQEIGKENLMAEMIYSLEKEYPDYAKKIRKRIE